MSVSESPQHQLQTSNCLLTRYGMPRVSARRSIIFRSEAWIENTWNPLKIAIPWCYPQVEIGAEPLGPG